jgi:hypothetical protein
MMPITPPLVVWSPIWRFALLIFLLVIITRLLVVVSLAVLAGFRRVATLLKFRLINTNQFQNRFLTVVRIVLRVSC